ncbi:hypothetical protein BH23ACT5_BH23ACT5_06770 [soil metagenome]
MAELALGRLVHELGDDEVPFVVLGGLVPEILTRGQDPPAPQHLGTTDVDLQLDLSLQLEAFEGLQRLEAALGSAGFAPSEGNAGWRWETQIEAATIKIEFLCELDDHPEGVAEIPGCERLRVSNLRGTGYVSEDWHWVDLPLEPEDQNRDVASVRFAGLEGFIMSKVHVAWRRGAAKDYYDLVYVLLYSPAGDPTDVAGTLAAGRFGDRIDLKVGPWPELRARFEHAHGVGPIGYSEQAVQADPSLDPAQARQDAVGAVIAFMEGLGERLPE